MAIIRKQDLIRLVAERTHLSEATVARTLQALLEEIGLALARKERVQISGLGTFDLRHFPPRKGRDPRTGQPVRHPERFAPSFRSSATLKRRVREGK